MLSPLAGLVLAAATPACVQDPQPPNILLIVADDLGHRDLGCTGSDFHATPALDGLAAAGLRFTQGYAAAANCAPSRAALMSGSYGPRTGVYTVNGSARGKATDRRVIPTENRTELAPEVTTVAELLRGAGYATGYFGKWHLGEGDVTGPLGQGFDVNFGGNRTGTPKSYTSPYRNPQLADGPPGEHLTDRLAREVTTWITAEREAPFFAVWAPHAVHTPIHPTAEGAALTAERARGVFHDHPGYAALVEDLDRAVGRVLAGLDAAELAQDTLVIFTSDNGGHTGFTTQAPLREGKGSFYEGGIRVPWIVRWPGRVDAGSVSDVPVHHVDLLPTLTAAAGIGPGSGPRDGVDLGPTWTGGAALDERALFWHFPAYLQANFSSSSSRFRSRPVSVIRRGSHKLLEFLEDGRLELFDLASDPGETRDLATGQPVRAAALRAELQAWRESVGAPVPTEPEPGYDPPPVATVDPEAPPPNFVLIVADDLGYGELGSYGQQHIETPRLDALAAEGLRFTQAYAGSPVCAPSRCALLTGRHPGRMAVRQNRGRPEEGQRPLPDEAVTVAERLGRAGYVSGAFGKWGLGGPNTEGLPLRQGFDHFFGYLDQWNAHSHYPPYLWDGMARVDLPGNADGGRGTYSHDLFTDRALEFLDARGEDRQPFFLYVPYAVPHVSLHVPADSLEPYLGRFEETPYPGAHYAGHETPRAAYAAMVSRMDRDVGRIVDRLDALGLGDNTLVLFTSDNGPTYAGGADSEFFDSTAGLRGLKGSVYEGGLRVPLIARWPGTVPAGALEGQPTAAWDLVPTFLQFAGLTHRLPNLDGRSLANTLHGKGKGRPRELYFELGRNQALRSGNWKFVRRFDREGAASIELFDLWEDPRETTNLAEREPDRTMKMRIRCSELREPSPAFPSPFDAFD